MPTNTSNPTPAGTFKGIPSHLRALIRNASYQDYGINFSRVGSRFVEIVPDLEPADFSLSPILNLFFYPAPRPKCSWAAGYHPGALNDMEPTMPRKSTPPLIPQPQLISVTAPIPKRALTVPEAAEVLSIGLTSMYSLIRDGQVKVVRVSAKGRGIVVPLTEIDAYLARATGMGA